MSDKPQTPWYGDALERVRILLDTVRPGDSDKLADRVFDAATACLEQAFDELDTSDDAL